MLGWATRLRFIDNRAIPKTDEVLVSEFFLAFHLLLNEKALEKMKQDVDANQRHLEFASDLTDILHSSLNLRRHLANHTTLHPSPSDIRSGRFK